MTSLWPKLAFVGKRIGWGIVAIVVLSSAVFLTLRVFTPGDPALNILGENASEGDLRAFRQRYGLDLPVTTQYANFIKKLARGDLGTSFEILDRDATITSIVAEVFPWTLELAFAAMLVAMFIALPLGLISALRQYSLLDTIATLIAFAGIAIPNFWLGPILIYWLTIQFKVFPNPVDDIQRFYSLVLPAIVLGTALSAKLTRMVRASTLETLGQQFIKTARAKGAGRFRVVTHHILQNSLLPVITVIGLQFGALLGGAIVTEKVFSRPGIGTLLLHAIEKRDFNLVQGCAIVILLCYIVVNTLTDILYGVVDPRIRISKGPQS